MNKTILLLSLLSWLTGLLGCANQSRQSSTSNSASPTEVTPTVDLEKRNALVEQYDLLHFYDKTAPVFLTLDEFFNGNHDEASIAPNLDTKLRVAEYYSLLKEVREDKKIVEVLVELKDVILYENNQLNDNEWFYTDVIYFIGDITPEEIAARVKDLQPDEVAYTEDERIMGLDERYEGNKIVYIWWD
ncbi:MAG TPA: hypothetical protein DCR93_24250 [Cytophagales bacterium]|nr:hypothetical protein [Cytophagales bacterium]HAP62473.1 hypothetical protein [Cytophagales bacterium]